MCNECCERDCECNLEFSPDTMFIDLAVLDANRPVWKVVFMDCALGECESHYLQFDEDDCYAEKLSELITISCVHDSIQVFWDQEITDEFKFHVMEHLEDVEFIVVDDDWVIRPICPECMAHSFSGDVTVTKQVQHNNSQLLKFISNINIDVDAIVLDVHRGGDESETSVTLIDIANGKSKSKKLYGGTFDDNAKDIVGLIRSLTPVKVIVDTVGLGLGLKDSIDRYIYESDDLIMDETGLVLKV